MLELVTVIVSAPSATASNPTLGVVPNWSPLGTQPPDNPNAGARLPTVPAVVEMETV